MPERFTFPFYYQPHPLSVLAAETLQEELKRATWAHNFGLQPGQEGLVLGKMFGVLVVQNSEGELGFLAAFSGKIANSNHHLGFVPPVFDVLDEEGFYRKGEEELNEMNRQIAALEQDPRLSELKKQWANDTREAEQQLELARQQLKTAKAARQQQREQSLPPDEMQLLEAALIEESKRDHFVLKDLKKHWKERLEGAENKLRQITDKLQSLKEARKNKSAALQQQIFDQYFFLNQYGAQKSLADIFQHNAATPPPAGAGECAAPKLLQYAFLHQLKPIAMAEFWWGESPVGEIRKHGHYYPACRGKCEPILAHVLEGIDMDENPMLAEPAADIHIDILFEDDHLLVVHKPSGLLSVPGKSVVDSVYFRMKRQFSDATGPLIVHRLDRATSGLMLIAKTEETYKNLQNQFLKHTIQKRYVAVLDGLLSTESGIVDLPLRVDLDDRPRQMVCYEHGKAARTEWQVVSRSNGQTRVHFHPITGRTHQLRVHAAHPRGLNMPIVGDDLYGTPASRLHLHAERIEFIHPISGEKQVFCIEAPF